MIIGNSKPNHLGAQGIFKRLVAVDDENLKIGTIQTTIRESSPGVKVRCSDQSRFEPEFDLLVLLSEF